MDPAHGDVHLPLRPLSGEPVLISERPGFVDHVDDKVWSDGREDAVEVPPLGAFSCRPVIGHVLGEGLHPDGLRPNGLDAALRPVGHEHGGHVLAQDEPLAVAQSEM